MLANASQSSRAATCEEWDEDAQTILPDTRTSANVDAKRLKPELASTKSHRRHTIVEGNAGRMSRTSTSGQHNALAGKEEKKKPDGLKLDTSFCERESRPYSSGPPLEHPRRSGSRPTAKRSVSKAGKPEPFIRHRDGECWICDRYGYHMMVPSEAQVPLERKSVPQSPLSKLQEPAHQPTLSAKVREPSNVQSRPSRSQTSRNQRPMSFHAGMSQEAYPLLSPHLSAADWGVPPNPISPYPYVPYAQPRAPMILQNSYRDHQQSSPAHCYPQPPPTPRPRPLEPHPNKSSRGEPVLQQSPVSRETPSLIKKTSKRERRHSRESSRSREEDASRMPPPQIVPAARRPGMIKANTSTSSPVSHKYERRYSNYVCVPAQSNLKERKVDPPPSSYREPHLSSYPTASQERLERSISYQAPIHSGKGKDSAPDLDLQVSSPHAERYEVEAEAYQQSHGTRPQPLTVEAVRKISRRSDSGSQRSINSSSRGSSGGKTKTTAASNDVMMTINGVTLGISGDSAENHSIKIQPKRNGGLNISVNDHERNGAGKKAANLQKRSGSTTSSSKQSRRSSEKEARHPLYGSSDFDRDRASRALGEPGKASCDNSSGHGVGYD